jgi:hypothetical protein
MDGDGARVCSKDVWATRYRGITILLSTRYSHGRRHNVMILNSFTSPPGRARRAPDSKFCHVTRLLDAYRAPLRVDTCMLLSSRYLIHASNRL